ncbi:MAG: phosphate acyltransferase PlsX [Bacillota bacterium]|uniref:phosphate acyltransferase PlsX n=1 Tax=Desulfurispora thermophila TaxID=265470 RepID=UPI00037F09BD|nr:phosphate acyltransferase PlsX [Desulfurispora thermophila]
MNIAVDAMGGDFAPSETVRGALLAARQDGLRPILVGDEEKIYAELEGPDRSLVEVVHAPEVIGMDESPAVAVRRKKNSSIVRAVQLVREGRAAAMVSAGNTGAVMAAGLLGLGRIKGIDRPAIASVLPTRRGKVVLLDAGANVDCEPHHLLQFALMGYLYARDVLGVSDPRVGLLNIGEEECKGNSLTQAAFSLLKESGLNFVGNVEGRDIFPGQADVVVCDGFVGNVVLKTSEGLAMTLLGMLKDALGVSWLSRLGALLSLPALQDLRRRLDYAEYGGAPLLGVNGAVVIGHGSSDARAIRNALRFAASAAQSRLVEKIAGSLGQLVHDMKSSCGGCGNA